VLFEGRSIYSQNVPTRGFQSATEPKLTIGLGSTSDIKEIIVTWPDGQCRSYTDLDIDEAHALSIKDGVLCTNRPSQLIDNVILKEIQAATEADIGGPT